MERDDHHRSSFLQSKSAYIVVHGSTGGDGGVSIHYDLTVVVLLEELKGVDYVVADVGSDREFSSRFVGYEERSGPARELDEMDEIEADRAFQRWVREVEEVDDGRSVVLIVDACEETEFGIGKCVLYVSSSFGLVSF